METKTIQRASTALANAKKRRLTLEQQLIVIKRTIVERQAKLQSVRAAEVKRVLEQEKRERGFAAKYGTIFEAAHAKSPLPKKGTAVRGYKKVYSHGRSVVAELIIPAHAERVMGKKYGGGINDYRKCRASEALVVSFDLPGIRTANSGHDRSYLYRVGKVCRPKGEPYDMSNATCEAGIHFFLTRAQARSYS